MKLATWRFIRNHNNYTVVYRLFEKRWFVFAMFLKVHLFLSSTKINQWYIDYIDYCRRNTWLNRQKTEEDADLPPCLNLILHIPGKAFWGERHRWNSDGVRSGKYDEYGNTSYPISIIFWRVVELVCVLSLPWCNATPFRLTGSERFLMMDLFQLSTCLQYTSELIVRFSTTSGSCWHLNDPCAMLLQFLVSYDVILTQLVPLFCSHQLRLPFLTEEPGWNQNQRHGILLTIYTLTVSYSSVTRNFTYSQAERAFFRLSK